MFKYKNLRKKTYTVSTAQIWELFNAFVEILSKRTFLSVN